MKNVLISSLGQSPGVVTGTVDALKFFDNVDIYKVITISTNDPIIINGAAERILRPEFKALNIEYENVNISASDINSPEDNGEYLEKIMDCFRANLISEEIQSIYVSLAGGRKTMSSLVFIGIKSVLDAYSNSNYLAKFKDLTHIIIDDNEIEKNGSAKNLLEIKEYDPELYKKCLFPVQGFGPNTREKVHLIRLSGMFKKADELQDTYEDIRDNSFEIARRILVS